jgi:hypothetical protein
MSCGRYCRISSRARARFTVIYRAAAFRIVPLDDSD